jgi:tetratricopeptide (TPR) repeat protein
MIPLKPSQAACTLSPTSVAGSNGHEAPLKGEDSTMVRSPTSVTMASSTSSLATAAATAPSIPAQEPSSGASTTAPPMPKPFFVMDWLEQINPRDLETARQMLQTPPKKGKPRPPHSGRGAPLPTETSAPSTTTTTSQNDDDKSRSLASSTESRSRIALPSLGSSEEASEPNQQDDLPCRQLEYPPTPPQAPKTARSSTNSITGCTISRSTSTSSAASSICDSSLQLQQKEQSKQGLEQQEEAPSRAPEIAASMKMSPFKKRSIAIGNGWNAKGLHKAKKGSWESALVCWENALEIRQQVLGEAHPDVANTLNNLGIACGKLGRVDDAIYHLERALEIRAKHYGTRTHVECAATLHNIGNVLAQAQDRAGAIQCFWDAKLISEDLLGENHIQVGRACVAIGNVYYEALQYEDAREAYYDALQVFANAGLPSTHCEVLAIQQDIQEIESMCSAAVHAHHHQYPVAPFHHQHHPPQSYGSNAVQQEQYQLHQQHPHPIYYPHMSYSSPPSSWLEQLQGV